MKKLTGVRLLAGTGPDADDIRYLTGFAAPDAVVCLQRGAQVDLVVPRMELGRAREMARGRRGVRVWTPQQLGLPLLRRRRQGDWALALLRGCRCRAVEVSPSFPLGIARRLEQGGVRLRLRDGSILPARRTKRPAEVARIRTAQRAAVAAMAAAVRALRAAAIGRDGGLRLAGAPLTSERLHEIIAIELLRHGCAADEIIAAGGAQGAQPHERGHGPLRAHVPIVLDIFPRHRGSGYWGDLTRTVVRGRAAPEVRRMFAAVRGAQRAALALVRAGMPVRRIHAAVERYFAGRGFRTEVRNGMACGFIHGTGHGVGLAIHEEPSLSANPDRLRAGDVVTVEPGLYYPELGGLRIEDTVLVTRTGHRLLCRCPVVFEV